MTAATPLRARDAFARCSLPSPRIPRVPPAAITAPAWSARATATATDRANDVGERRLPSWSEVGLIVLSVTAVCAGLLFIMLERTALHLDRQMELVSISRESSSPVTTTAP